MTAELVKKVTYFGTYFGELGYVNSSCIRKKNYFDIFEFLKR